MRRLLHHPVTRRTAFVLLLVLAAELLAACGSGGGGGGEQPNLVTITGRFDLDSVQLAGADGKAYVTTAWGTAEMGADGSFEATVSNDHPQVAIAHTQDGTPLGLTVSPGGGRQAISRQLSLWKASDTAAALIFMSPFVIQDDPTNAQTVLAAIQGSGEAQFFAAVVDDRLRKDPNALSREDPTVAAAANSAVTAVVAALKSSRRTARLVRQIEVQPTGTQSGVDLSYTGSTIKIVNNYARHLFPKFRRLQTDASGAVLRSETYSPRFYLEPRSMIMGPSTYEEPADLQTWDTWQIKLTGFGLQGLGDLQKDQDAIDGFVCGLMFDLVVPILAILLGASDAATGKAFSEVAKYFLVALKGIDMLNMVIEGRWLALVKALIATVISVILSDSMLIKILSKIWTGITAVAKAVVGACCLVVKIAFIVYSAIQLIYSFVQMAMARVVETWTVRRPLGGAAVLVGPEPGGVETTVETVPSGDIWATVKLKPLLARP